MLRKRTIPFANSFGKMGLLTFLNYGGVIDSTAYMICEMHVKDHGWPFKISMIV